MILRVQGLLAAYYALISSKHPSRPVTLDPCWDSSESNLRKASSSVSLLRRVGKGSGTLFLWSLEPGLLREVAIVTFGLVILIGALAIFFRWVDRRQGPSVSASSQLSPSDGPRVFEPSVIASRLRPFCGGNGRTLRRGSRSSTALEAN